ncbi:DUF6046 domain-containing protein [Carboxylicivirga linearis]|uniref:DUF6046 domain-containing protein n=1 Tax=Carboxylicivirga linearis TaxID=1628157 RepID=A0ABS5K0K3_9BACT|nr:DUF6046 domain-containing protein [Carboxylicivirga linearis]MBS2100710.1 hypothetical protein [Carboxylicivirga linearis]
MISLSGIVERYNEAFGYTAMKIAPRIIQATGLGLSNFMLSNIPVLSEPDTSYADMIFTNSLDQSKRYSFGVPTIEGGHRAIPFLKPTEASPNSFIAPPPMVSFRRGKHVVRTSIDRSNYEVVENFGMKPYEISLQGILVDVEEHHYPQELVQTMHELFEASGTYAVSSEIFDNLGITEIFFDDDFEVTFVEGYVDTVKYRAHAIAVSSAEFLLQEQ